MPDPLVRLILEERWSLETYLFHPALRDYQSLFLQGIPWKRIDFIGVTENFDEDLSRLSTILKRPLKGFHENVGPKHDALSKHASLKSRFLDFHRKDAELYRFALERRDEMLQVD